MDAVEKRQRDLELLRKSRRALDEGELVDRHAEPAPAPSAAPVEDDDTEVVMYRGKPVRRKKAGGSGGKGQRPASFRGATVGRGSKSKPQATNDVRVVLERLNGLYKDGLITKSEYDRKRSQILDRM